ncbi:hypothetical protein Csa_015234 [Cucumis sativus]|nr:hypothetical protein Csa_015234 [Cucumis sativus]
MVALIHHAVDRGITRFGTSDNYGPFTNEILVGKAFKDGNRDKVEVATKFGNTFADDGKREIRGDPAYVRAACEASLKRLDVDCINLYYQHRIDTRVPVEVTLALAWVRHQGNDVCPIPGRTKIENLNQNIGALAVKLTPQELAVLEGFAAYDVVKGDRYGSALATWKTSETPPLSSWKA